MKEATVLKHAGRFVL